MNKDYEEILKELGNAKVSILNIEKILSITSNTTIITTSKEFECSMNEVAKFLAKSNNESTIRGMKHRLENNKKKVTVNEAYEIQEKFGIPIYAWKDIKWYQKSLTPSKR